MPYYVMPLIDGVGLDRILADPDADVPADPSTAPAGSPELGRQAAEALAHAHEQGILHRDIKPANLLLDSAGTLWLADFGLAKLADDLALTGTGELPGTLRYLAPECLTAEPDARSDVYSLGLTLYELLVGRPAFGETDRVRLLHQIQWEPVDAAARSSPRRPARPGDDHPQGVGPGPGRRGTPRPPALADDLRRFLDGRPILGRRASRWERLGRWRRRNPVVSALAALSIVLALFGGYFFVLFLAAPHPPRRATPPPRRGRRRRHLRRAPAGLRRAARRPAATSSAGVSDGRRRRKDGPAATLAGLNREILRRLRSTGSPRRRFQGRRRLARRGIGPRGGPRRPEGTTR